MAVVLNLKETIKTFVLAPAVAFLSYVATNIVVSIGTSLNAFVSGTTTYYPLAVAGITFAIMLVYGIDEMISNKPATQ